MKKLNKFTLLCMMFGLCTLTVQDIYGYNLFYQSAAEKMNFDNLSNYVPFASWFAPEKTYFEKVGDYLSSQEGIQFTAETLRGIAMTAGTFYILQRALYSESTNLTSEQSMQIFYPGDDLQTTFKDVAGLAGAKADMQDIISYLKNPEMYTKLGAHVPKGLLMNGGPGNGKTLLARALAKEVDRPFISVSGSSFANMFVGVGAERVRDLFTLARELAAEYGGCIIFIDEVDAVAQKRSGGFNQESDAILTEFLQAMDGLCGSENPIIVIAATNRIETLDPAFVRPGRFDRKVEVTKPFVKDRVELITIALSKIPHTDDINIDRIARATGGFSGAELANLFNEAAMLAAGAGRDVIGIQDIELAHDHITLGREIHGMEQSNDVKWKTAIHEAGHAIAWVFGNNPKYALHKASITPRSNTLGVVHAVPVSESYESTAAEMKSQIVVALCGGFAEEEFGFDQSTGPVSDLAVAHAIAYSMVVDYGMSDALRYISYTNVNSLPNDIATNVHREVEKIINECRDVAKKLVSSRKHEIEIVAKLLMEKGTVLGDEIYNLLEVSLPDISFSFA